MTETMRQKLMELADSRSGKLAEAEAALAAEDRAGYDAAMEAVGNLNGQMEQVRDLIREQERKALEAPGPAGARC